MICIGFADALSLTSLLAAWGLSEIFARRMRLALPSILLAVMFAASAALLVGQLSGVAVDRFAFNAGWLPVALRTPGVEPHVWPDGATNEPSAEDESMTDIPAVAAE